MKLKLTLLAVLFASAGLIARAEDPVVQGKTLATKKCQMCHAIDGKGGKNKPLNGMAEGKTDEQLTAAIMDPKTAIGPDTKMPSYKGKLTDDEVKAIIAYMRTLK